MSKVTRETATVYRALTGRRYLTEKAAFRASVIARLKSTREPDAGDDRNVGYHSQEQFARFARIAARAWKMMIARRRRKALEVGD